jgi:hypothetical protein
METVAQGPSSYPGADTSNIRQIDLLTKLKATPVPDLAQGVSMKYVYPDLPTYKPQQLETLKPSHVDVRNHKFHQ